MSARLDRGPRLGLRGGRRGKAAVEPLGNGGMEEMGRVHASSTYQVKSGSCWPAELFGNHARLSINMMSLSEFEPETIPVCRSRDKPTGCDYDGLCGCLTAQTTTARCASAVFRARRIELLGQRKDRQGLCVDGLDQPGEIGERARQPVDLVNDHDVDPLAATVSRSEPIVSSARQTWSRHRER